MRQLGLALSAGVLAVFVAGLTSMTRDAPSEESGRRAVSHAGGQLTVITGTDRKGVRIRSTRFRCLSCVRRVVGALRTEPGVSQVGIEENTELPAITVRFFPSTTNKQRIGEAVKRALESDPYNTAPVKLSYEREEKNK